MKTLKDPQITVEYLNATLEEIEDPDPTLDTQNIYKRKKRESPHFNFAKAK